MWHSLETLPQGQASFVGSLTGSFVGLFALLCGALFNAYLNRRRDDRLRRQEARSTAAALRAELAGVCETLEINAAELQKNEPHDFIVPDIAHSVRVLPTLLPKLGLLDVETIREVIDANIVIEQYCEQLTMRGGVLGGPTQMGARRLIAMKADTTEMVAKMNDVMAKRIKGVLERLDAYLR